MSVFDRDEAREIAEVIRNGESPAALVYATLALARYTAMLVDEQRTANLIASHRADIADEQLSFDDIERIVVARLREAL